MNAYKLMAAGALLAAISLPAFAQGPGNDTYHPPRMGRMNTPGWSMMTPAERKEHMEKMQGMKSREECMAYMDEHHKMMEERAKAKGKTVTMSRHKACDMMMKPSAAPSPKK